jgi:hypothetical protein
MCGLFPHVYSRQQVVYPTAVGPQPTKIIYFVDRQAGCWKCVCKSEVITIVAVDIMMSLSGLFNELTTSKPYRFDNGTDEEVERIWKEPFLT